MLGLQRGSCALTLVLSVLGCGTSGGDAESDAGLDYCPVRVPCLDGSFSCNDTGDNKCPLDPAPAVCEVPTPGPVLTIRVHNIGQRHLRLDFGCGNTLPLEIDGKPASAGQVDSCEFDCASVTADSSPPACEACAEAVHQELEPGGTLEIPWDRRTFLERALAKRCSGNAVDQVCGFGADAGSLAQGTTHLVNVTFCSEVEGEPGYCGPFEKSDGVNGPGMFDLTLDALDFNVD